MTLEQTFHDATRNLGGRLARETADDHTRAVLGAVEAEAQDLIAAARRALPTLPEVHVDFVENAALSAVAFQSDSRYFIGLYAGTVLLVQQVTGRLLADARTFPTVGNPGAERDDLPVLQPVVSDATALLRQELPMRPSDPARRQYAEYLEHQALMFLVGHELAHITCGHVAFLNAAGQRQLSEHDGGFDGQGEGARIERQALEHHADTRSVYSRIDSLRVTFENPDRQAALWRADAAHPMDLFEDWATSTHLLFHLFGDMRFNPAALDRSPYPALAVRLLACDYLAVTAAQQLFGGPAKTFAIDSIRRVRRETHRALAAMFGSATSAGSSDADEEDLYAHARRLNRCLLTELYPALTPFAYEAL